VEICQVLFGGRGDISQWVLHTPIVGNPIFLDSRLCGNDRAGFMSRDTPPRDPCLARELMQCNLSFQTFFDAVNKSVDRADSLR
jgi:hypothetical protein